MKKAVARQPVVAAIAANNKYIHSYASGIIDAEDCIKTVKIDDELLNTVNHAVVIVGYGTD